MSCSLHPSDQMLTVDVLLPSSEFLHYFLGKAGEALCSERMLLLMCNGKDNLWDHTLMVGVTQSQRR